MLWQNSGWQNGLILRMLFSELYKLWWIKLLSYVLGGDRPNLPLDPPLPQVKNHWPFLPSRKFRSPTELQPRILYSSNWQPFCLFWDFTNSAHQHNCFANGQKRVTNRRNLERRHYRQMRSNQICFKTALHVASLPLSLVERARIKFDDRVEHSM